MTHVLLVGNPNAGKTTLFNALTGDCQRVGNWPGVTVEQKTGAFDWEHVHFDLTDLPGIYSLACPDFISIDEQIAAKAVIELAPDLIINVVDACHLERHLYLSSQLLELACPMIVALTMSDLAKQSGIEVDIDALQKRLSCPVLRVGPHKGEGIDALKNALLTKPSIPQSLNLLMPVALTQLVKEISERARAFIPDAKQLQYYVYRLLEGDVLSQPKLADAASHALLQTLPDADILISDARYKAIHEISTAVITSRRGAQNRLTAGIDRVVLHRFWAIPIFLGLMYLMFFFAITLGGVFQDFFDLTSEAVFVQGSAWCLQQLSAPDWLIALIANGVGKGINTTVTFIPVLAGMYFFLSLLEASGYMARAAFVVDRLMRALGLPGKAFVPMIVGFGCNVPGIMAARTLETERERILTILMTPFMSCSARLAIYAVFVAAFFPFGGQNVVFSLYLIGVLVAVLTGFLLRRTLFAGPVSPLSMELPLYHRPEIRRLLKETSMRLRFFVTRAGRVIVPVCIVLGGLNALHMPSELQSSATHAQSVLSYFGQWLTPLFSPMGLSSDNWPATVGLLTGMLAKEVVIGTLNALYVQGTELGSLVSLHDIGQTLWQAFDSLLQNVLDLGGGLTASIREPLSLKTSEMSHAASGAMQQHFDGQIGAYAYLLFILLYIPCVSTIATIRQETNRQLMVLSVVWSFIVAYTVAVAFYQVSTSLVHPRQTLFCLGVLLIFLVILFKWLSAHTRSGGAYVTRAS